MSHLSLPLAMTSSQREIPSPQSFLTERQLPKGVIRGKGLCVFEIGMVLMVYFLLFFWYHKIIEMAVYYKK